MAGPSISLLKELFIYDRETSTLRNRISRAANCRAGQEAGFVNGNGYRRVSLGKYQYYTHQIIWALEHGYWPDHEIDYRDRDTVRNDPNNLRKCGRFGNTQNRGKRAHSGNPFKGVYRDKRKKNAKWYYKIQAFLEIHRVGGFSTPEEAHESYLLAAKRLHGEFAEAA